jgi:hypothetical protein
LWNQFLRPHDVLIVYHGRTHRLLENAGVSQTNCLVLKSIFGHWRNGIRSLEELFAAESLPLPIVNEENRAALRLEMAAAMVQHLRTTHASSA